MSKCMLLHALWTIPSYVIIRLLCIQAPPPPSLELVSGTQPLNFILNHMTNSSLC
jgi:hypothetical protein